MLRGGIVKQIYALKGQGCAIWEIARRLEISRNTVRKYVRAPEIPQPKPRPKRGSKLDPSKDYILRRLAEGVDNCVVLLREIRAMGYDGGYTILKESSFIPCGSGGFPRRRCASRRSQASRPRWTSAGTGTGRPRAWCAGSGRS
jgi:hypothetical protein